MVIKIITDSISRDELRKLACEHFGDFVKAVVDIEQGIMAVGGELHADEEVSLVELEGSRREFVWGINLYPDKQGEEFIEYDSMVNLKPMYSNRSRSVEDSAIREKIKVVVGQLVKP